MEEHGVFIANRFLRFPRGLLFAAPGLAMSAVAHLNEQRLDIPQ
jgi:hypothetical protein